MELQKTRKIGHEHITLMDRMKNIETNIIEIKDMLKIIINNQQEIDSKLINKDDK